MQRAEDAGVRKDRESVDLFLPVLENCRVLFGSEQKCCLVDKAVNGFITNAHVCVYVYTIDR